MMSWFRQKQSAESAKERLQLVLIHDRTDLTSTELNVLKDELLQVISRHVDIDRDAVQIDVEHDGRAQRLVADIPLRSVTRRRAG
ncbi:MAG TPA: cell division topological specificity factor MinE [Anaerolineales bacterium]|nr:cell division topological specificity factor MinE [Anaerolineales bacterium]